MHITPEDVKRVLQILDDKYFNQITLLIGAFIDEYFQRMHPDMNHDEIDIRINFWANTWYVELLREILRFENLSEDSFDGGAFIDQ